jgi:hypothetical protein
LFFFFFVFSSGSYATGVWSFEEAFASKTVEFLLDLCAGVGSRRESELGRGSRSGGGEPTSPPINPSRPYSPLVASAPSPLPLLTAPPSLPHSQVLAAAIPYNPSRHPPSPLLQVSSFLVRIFFVLVQVSSGELVGRRKEEKVELKVILRLSMLLR